MVCGLFSVFDPVVYSPLFGGVDLKWFSSLCLVLCFFWQFGPLCSGLELIKKEIIVSISSLVSGGCFVKKSKLVFSSVFVAFVGMNLSGLSPLSFSTTSHPLVVLQISLLFFIPWVYVSVVSKGLEFLSHFLPQGSPFPLWGFLVLIETVSVFIRPFTLAIRLVANMMAGHLFIEMLSSIWSIYPLLYPLLSGLLLFEIAVGVVQAFVFTNLLIMYWSE